MTSPSETTKKPSPVPLIIWFLEVIIVLVFCCVVIGMCLLPKAPIFTVTDLYALTTRSANLSVESRVEIYKNATVVLSLEITNPNKEKDILYDATKVTVYKNGSVVGTRFLPGFYQDGRSTLSSLVLVGTEQNKLEIGGTRENDTLMVGVETTVRYRILRWTTKRHRLNLEVSLPVNDSGKLSLGDEGVQLKQMKTTRIQRHD